MATLDELLFGAKLEAWRHNMFHITFGNVKWFWEL